MGLDPEHPIYEPGDDCTLCSGLLFAGITPKYVEIDVFGITACPIAFDPAPNGTWGLAQAEGPCVWRLTSGVYSFMWKLDANRSQLSIWQGMWPWFIADVVDECFDAFINSLVGCVGPIYGIGGYVTCWWGPTIGR